MTEPIKLYMLSEEEARAVVLLLRSSYAPQDLQKIVYNLISRLEKELAT